jgi:hypothetical protein
MIAKADVRRWRVIEGHVLCEFHGDVHPRVADYYEMDEPDCGPANWRNLAVLGTAADVDGY